MSALHALPVPVVDLRPVLREELARLDRLRDGVATQLTIENFKHYLHTSPPGDARVLIDRPIAPPPQPAIYAGVFAGRGAQEAALGPPAPWRRRYTPAELEAAYHRTVPPRTGPRVAATLGLRLLTFYNQLYFHGLTLKRLRIADVDLATGTTLAYRMSQRSRGLAS